MKTTDDSITLAWDAPKNAEVTACGGYIVEKLKEEETFFQAHNPGQPCKTTECTVKALEFMSRWQFRVKCISEAGPGEPCEPTQWITVEMDKLPPQIELWEGAADGLNVKVTQNRMVMPAKIVGRPAPEVTWQKEDYPLSVDARVSIKTTDKMSTFTMSDLNRSDSGVYTIFAENEHGKVEKKIKVNVMDKPGIPEDFDIVDITNNSCKLVWKDPLDIGGAKVRNYIVEKREVGRSVWGKMSAEVKPEAYEYVAERLIEGREYEFRVAAKNDLGYGEGALSAPIIAAYLFDTPEQMNPVEKTGDATKSTITVKWAAPEWDGGSPINGFWLEMSSPDSQRWSKVNRKPLESGKRKFTIENLKEGRDYIFRVCASNLAGLGTWSEPSEPEKASPPDCVPGRPGKPEILAVGTSTATLKWAAPIFVPGAGKVDHYQLEMRKRNQNDDNEKEAERKAELKNAAKANKQTWIRKLPEFAEFEIASPTLELECEINANVNETIHWKKDGKVLIIQIYTFISTHHDT